MMARWICCLTLATVVLGSGCCCFPCHNPCGGCFGLPRPITWSGDCNECRQCPGDACGSCSSSCGLWPGLCHSWRCDKGCSDVYINEWISDPPDCCDPCDQCYGQFMGPQGPCCLGPAQRILSALHGYRYCPRPYCGPWCPLFGGCKAPCGPACGPACGCDSCGGEMPHGADVYYDGPPAAKSSGPAVQPHTPPTPSPDTSSILDENWDAPRARPEPGRPLHNARQPARGQMGYRQPPAPQFAERQAAAQRQGLRQPVPAARPAAGGVRQTNYRQ